MRTKRAVAPQPRRCRYLKYRSTKTTNADPVNSFGGKRSSHREPYRRTVTKKKGRKFVRTAALEFRLKAETTREKKLLDFVARKSFFGLDEVLHLALQLQLLRRRRRRR